jgi:demethylmenaquinone methyltransferase/2-methoxy-6-polyprenyl-1,4-benzoquinol methylase
MTGETPPLSRLDQAFTSPYAKQRYVRRLFSTIADRYDFITVLLSFGMDRRWKQRAVDLAAPREGMRVLDVACGTGDLAFAASSRGASVVGLDVTHRMLQLARLKARALRPPASRTPHPARTAHPARLRQGSGGSAEALRAKADTPVFVTADMSALPFPDAQFDIVTTGYGLRNVPDLALAVTEIRRVLRQGGTLVSLDFNRPDSVLVRTVYLAYLAVVGGVLGWLLHRDPDTYRYIPASIRRYPGAARVAELLEAEGFARAEWTAVLGGLMAIHVAQK